LPFACGYGYVRRMEMKGEVKIDAPRTRVWAALANTEILKQSIPGCVSLEKVSDTEFKGTVETKVGLVRATFNGKAVLSKLNPPISLTVTGDGSGGAAGTIAANADLELHEEGDSTLLRYTASGQVNGKLAQVGARLLDTTARQMADSFFVRFAERVTEGPLGRAEDAVEQAVEEAVHAVGEVAHEAEEEVEGAAVRGFLGGPMMWGLLVIVAGVIILWFTRG
jgi:carbon monoxide dehydrogenase subunit G